MQDEFHSLESEAAWVLLTPSVDDCSWRSAIEQAMKKAGRMVICAGLDDAAHRTNANVVIVTHDPSDLAEVKRASIIIPQPHTAPNAVAALLGLAPPDHVRHASAILAKALALSKSFPTVTQDDLSAGPVSIDLLGVSVIPPEPCCRTQTELEIMAAFDIYRRLPSASVTPAIWAESLFVYDQRARQANAVLGDVDVTGPPKLLIYGPYIALPPGAWRTVIRFGVDKDAAVHEFRFDWGTRTACLSENVRPMLPGFYEITLEWAWEEADASEIRIIITEGAFHGTLMFRGITVQPIG